MRASIIMPVKTCAECGITIENKWEFIPSIEVPGAFHVICPDCMEKHWHEKIPLLKKWKCLFEKKLPMARKCASCGMKMRADKSGPLKGWFLASSVPVPSHPGLWVQVCKDCAARRGTTDDE
jgi:hypothetical protein